MGVQAARKYKFIGRIKLYLTVQFAPYLDDNAIRNPNISAANRTGGRHNFTMTKYNIQLGHDTLLLRDPAPI
jgi:hypothetical protein